MPQRPITDQARRIPIRQEGLPRPASLQAHPDQAAKTHLHRASQPNKRKTKFRIWSISFRENSLFDTGKMSRSFFGPEIFFVPYLTLTSTFIPNLTLPSNPLANGVNWMLKRRFCPQKKKRRNKFERKKTNAFFCSWAHASKAGAGFFAASE